MRRRTYLALGAGFVGGVGARHAVEPLQGQFEERALRASESALATDFDVDSADDLQLSPTDFTETGWEYFGDTDTDASADAVQDANTEAAPSNASEALFYDYDTGAIVLTVVALAETTDEARTAYQEIRDRHAQQYSLAEDLGIAVDDHAFRTEASFVVFRIRNAIGIVGHEPDGTSPTIEDAVSVAELMASTWSER
jgi:hypothetical protein